MQIQRQNTFSPNFRAIHIANSKNVIKNVETNIKIYELNAKDDKPFLIRLPGKINMQNLMPDMTQYAYERWHEMLRFAVDSSLENDRKTLLATVDNKPCGLAVFLPGKNKFHLDCICTWPVEFGRKVTLAGTTLFKHMFEIFQNSKAEKIKLEAITNGPFDTVSKYKKLGFIELGWKDDHEILMETNKPRVQNTLKRLNNLIFTEEIPNSPKENLCETFDITL